MSKTKPKDVYDLLMVLGATEETAVKIGLKDILNYE
jgi:hypothetical protein